MKYILIASAGVLALTMATAQAFPGSTSEAGLARAKPVIGTTPAVRVYQGKGKDHGLRLQSRDQTNRTAILPAQTADQRNGPDRQDADG